MRKLFKDYVVQNYRRFITKGWETGRRLGNLQRYLTVALCSLNGAKEKNRTVGEDAR